MKSTKGPGTESRPEYNPLHTELQTPSEKVLVKVMKYKTDGNLNTLVKPNRRPVSDTSSAESFRPNESRG